MWWEGGRAGGPSVNATAWVGGEPLHLGEGSSRGNSSTSTKLLPRLVKAQQDKGSPTIVLLRLAKPRLLSEKTPFLAPGCTLQRATTVGPNRPEASANPTAGRDWDRYYPWMLGID